MKISKQDLLYYIVLIPFLHPRGFDEVSLLYKRFFTLWLYVSMLVILWNVVSTVNIRKIGVSKKGTGIAAYFLLVVLITVFSRKSLSSGLQNMFSFPMITLFLILNLQRDAIRLIKVLANILILNLFLSITVFHPFFSKLFHLTFLGHVQVVSQVGLLAVFSACILFMTSKKYKRKAMVLLILSGVTMFTTDADSAVLACIIVLCAGIAYKWKLYGALCFNSVFYIVLFFCFSAFVIYGAVSGLFQQKLSFIPTDLTFSGRNAIWEGALQLFRQRPVFGYGVDGVLIKVYWGKEMNYAHNQIMQILLDGGIVLSVAFWGMLCSFAMYINRVKQRRYKVLANSVLIAYLFVMIFDSTTLYCYMFVFLSMATCLPQIEKFSQRGTLYESDYKNHS